MKAIVFLKVLHFILISMFIKFNDINYINNLTIFIYLQTKKIIKKIKVPKKKNHILVKMDIKLKVPRLHQA